MSEETGSESRVIVELQHIIRELRHDIQNERHVGYFYRRLYKAGIGELEVPEQRGNWRNLNTVERAKFLEWVALANDHRNGPDSYGRQVYGDEFQGDPIKQLVEEALDILFYSYIAQKQINEARHELDDLHTTVERLQDENTSLKHELEEGHGRGET